MTHRVSREPLTSVQAMWNRLITSHSMLSVP